MLRAVDKEGNDYFAYDIVTSEDVLKIRQLIAENKLLDPLFGQAVTYRKTHMRGETFVRGHFVRRFEFSEEMIRSQLQMRLDPDPDYFRLVSHSGKVIYKNNESLNHILGKLWIIEEKKKEYGHLFESGEISIIPEFHLCVNRWDVLTNSYSPATRVADVMIFYKDRAIEAIEVQKSPMAVDSTDQQDNYTLIKRTNDYEKKGISVTWVFIDEAARNRELQYYVEENYGDFYFLCINRETRAEYTTEIKA